MVTGAGRQGGPSCNRIVSRTRSQLAWPDPTSTEGNTYRVGELCRLLPCRHPRRPTLAEMVTQAGSVQDSGGGW